MNTSFPLLSGLDPKNFKKMQTAVRLHDDPRVAEIFSGAIQDLLRRTEYLVGGISTETASGHILADYTEWNLQLDHHTCPVSYAQLIEIIDEFDIATVYRLSAGVFELGATNRVEFEIEGHKFVVRISLSVRVPDEDVQTLRDIGKITTHAEKATTYEALTC